MRLNFTANGLTDHGAHYLKFGPDLEPNANDYWNRRISRQVLEKIYWTTKEVERLSKPKVKK
jgi:hypothetical protein